MMENTKTFNVNILPSPTYRWLQVNGAYLEERDYSSSAQDICVESGETKDCEHIRLSQHSISDKDTKDTVNIRAKSGSRSVYIIDHNLEKDGISTALDINCDIEESAEVFLVQIQRMGKKSDLQSRFVCDLAKNAALKVIQVFLGGRDTFSEIKCSLMGDGASFSLESAYRLAGGQKLDINYIVDHYGKNTECTLKSMGVMYSGSEKIYRGTIDFKKGCKGAVGNETEDVLLMEEDVINKTVPVILCAEEDVEGNHGATIGRISEELMFYMLSRGLTREEVYDMLASGRIESVIKHIPDEELKETL